MRDARTLKVEARARGPLAFLHSWVTQFVEYYSPLDDFLWTMKATQQLAPKCKSEYNENSAQIRVPNVDIHRVGIGGLDALAIKSPQQRGDEKHFGEVACVKKRISDTGMVLKSQRLLEIAKCRTDTESRNLKSTF